MINMASVFQDIVLGISVSVLWLFALVFFLIWTDEMKPFLLGWMLLFTFLSCMGFAHIIYVRSN